MWDSANSKEAVWAKTAQFLERRGVACWKDQVIRYAEARKAEMSQKMERLRHIRARSVHPEIVDDFLSVYKGVVARYQYALQELCRVHILP